MAWCAYELVTRMACKPYVKEGPWWGRHLRAATWPDMAAYVGMKNLLIGAGLFLASSAVGVLPWLHGLPELQWLH
jgi:NosR/NirI family nitrous oxide reductase transcriptional regulator